MVIVSKGAFNADFDLQTETDNRFHFYVAAGTQVASTMAVTTGVWYHVAGTWDSTGLRIYVNGVLENTNAVMGLTRGQSNLPLRIGDCGGGVDVRCGTPRFFQGLIDESEVFNRALTASEIVAIYNAGSTGKCPLPTPT